MSIGGISGGMFDMSSMQARFQEMRAERFSSADADQSGGLTLDELTKAAENSPLGSANRAGGPSIEDRFAHLDADSDGTVTEDEFMSARPPAPPHGDFSPGMMRSLLELLSSEESSSDPATSASETGASGETELVDALIDSLEETEEA